MRCWNKIIKYLYWHGTTSVWWFNCEKKYLMFSQTWIRWSCFLSPHSIQWIHSTLLNIFCRSRNKTIELETSCISESWTFDVSLFLLCWVISQLFDWNSSNSFHWSFRITPILDEKDSNDQIFFCLNLMDRYALVLLSTRNSYHDQIDRSKNERKSPISTLNFTGLTKIWQNKILLDHSISKNGCSLDYLSMLQPTVVLHYLWFDYYSDTDVLRPIEIKRNDWICISILIDVTNTQRENFSIYDFFRYFRSARIRILVYETFVSSVLLHLIEIILFIYKTKNWKEKEESHLKINPFHQQLRENSRLSFFNSLLDFQRSSIHFNLLHP